MGNKGGGKASLGPREKKADAQRNPSVYEERAGGDTIQRAAGRVVHEDATRRPRGVRGMPGHGVAGAGQKPRKSSRCGFKSRDAAKTVSEMEASVSEKKLRLAADAVKMEAEDERLQAE